MVQADDYASFKLDPSSATLGKLRKLLRLVFQSRGGHQHMAAPVAAEAIRPLGAFFGAILGGVLGPWSNHGETSPIRKPLLNRPTF